nr:hypothetical protein [Cellulomonas sp. NS3]
MTLTTLPIWALELPSDATVWVVDPASSTASPATRAAVLALREISPIDASISRAPAVTVRTFPLTWSAAATAPAWADVSSVATASCSDVSDSSSDEAATSSAESRAWPITARMLCCALVSARAMAPTSSRERGPASTVRSPAAMASSERPTACSGRVTVRAATSDRPTAAAMPSPATSRMSRSPFAVDRVDTAFRSCALLAWASRSSSSVSPASDSAGRIASVK